MLNCYSPRSLILTRGVLSSYCVAGRSYSSEPHFEPTSGSSYLWTQQVPLRLLNVPRQLQGAGLTLVARTVHQGLAYVAFGHYRSPYEYASGGGGDTSSTVNSTLCLQRQRCLGGTYAGLESQGLFWSLRQFPAHQKKRIGRIISRVATQPIDVRISAYDGLIPLNTILSLSDQDPALSLDPCQDPAEFRSRHLCHTLVRRSYFDPARVQRIELSATHPGPHGRLRGTLFRPLVPPTSAHLPVLNLFGYGSGLLEHRAALLAHEGFLSLALAFYRYQDLPRDLQHIDLDYFEEAVDYLLKEQMQVNSSTASPHHNDDCAGGNAGRVSVVGLSKGADIAALLPSLMPDKIAGSVPINCLAYSVVHPNLYRGQLTPPDLPKFDTEHIELTNHGVSYRNMFSTNDHFVLDERTQQQQPIPSIPVERCGPGTRYLFVYSSADLTVEENQTQLLLDRLDRAGKADQAELLYLPNAGHLLEPPYIPLTRKGFVTHYEKALDYGGMSTDHQRAQMLFWDRLLSFLRSF